MKKEILETFIDRYYLKGLINKVKWKYSASEKLLYTRAAIDNRSFVVDVNMNEFTDFGADDLIICIGDTERVKAMLSPFGEDLDFLINKNGDKILGFTLSNADIECYCSAADPSAMDPVPKNLQDIPEYHVEVPLTEEFMEKFKCAHKALKDVDSFSVHMNKKGVFEIVIGYTTSNSNRIRITPTTNVTKNTIEKSILFPIKNIIEVISANESIPNGTLSITNSGIMQLYFKNDKFTFTSYQFCNAKQ